ncbi:MAG: hypothetical protein WCR52_20420 [Bacteroidota bacterium]
MKKVAFIVSTLCLICLATFIQSCQKTSDGGVVTTSTEDQTNALDRQTTEPESYYEFYLDDIRVSKLPIDTTQDQWIYYTSNSNSAIVTVQVRQYTTRQKYEAYGSSIGVNLRGQLAIADRLRFVADSAGLTDHITDLSQIPQWYLDLEHSLISNFTGGSTDRFLGTTIKKDGSERGDCSSWGGNFFLPGIVSAWPFMPPTWNNKTSGVNNGDVWGSFNMWDKIFFRKFLGSVNGFGFVTVPLCGTAADRRTSSCIRYGL